MQNLSSEEIKILAQKFLTGTTTPEETALLKLWMDANPGEELIWDLDDSSENQLSQRLFNRIRNETVIKPSSFSIYRYRKIWTAAAVLLFIMVGAYLWFYNSKDSNNPQLYEASLESIIPGKEKAILTLGNGQQIELTDQESIKDGLLTIKNKNNELTYENSSVFSYNTMTTPRGGQYKLVLPDGSKVWLNASSTITYPTKFIEDIRHVKVSGEAYFEITKDKSHPFVVTVGSEKIEVLGTEFNVNSYSNEPVRQTTLIEGSIRIGSKTLKPGEAMVDGRISKVNTQAVVSWKKGIFSFHDADLASVARQLERWYDIDIKIEGEISKEPFQGELSRSLNLSQIMKILSYMEIQYKMETKRTLIISSK